MRSYEVLKQIIEEVGTKQVASDLRVSSSLVYKWCAEPPEEEGDDASGARNPLDRVMSLIESTGDRRPVEWLCGEVGGFFVETTELEETVDATYIKHTQTLLAEFSDLLQILSDSISHEGRIDASEAIEIRRQWRRLQGQGEAFVRACERGHFDPER
jgi:hypothetical protein